MIEKTFKGQTKQEAFDTAFKDLEQLIVDNDVNCSVLRHIRGDGEDYLYFRLNTSRMCNMQIVKMVVQWGDTHDVQRN